MSVLVIGGSGFIGRPLVAALAGAGCEVVAVDRSVADRRDPASIVRLVRERRAQIVIDLIAYTLAETAPLLDVLAGEVGRYVLASSADVYRNYGGLHRRETPEPRLAPMDEAAPLRTSRHPYRADPLRNADDPQRRLDDYDKIPIEQAVAAQTGIEWTILRLPMVFGPGDKQRRFRWAIRPPAEARPTVEVVAEWADWRTTYGYVDDVAAGIALAATHPAARNRTFNLGEADAPDHAAWLDRFALATGWRGAVVRTLLAEAGGAQADALRALDLRYPLVLDTRAIRRDLTYAEPTPLEEALSRALSDELGH